MDNKQNTVYVLSGVVDYEDSTILGVFSTLLLAEEAEKEHSASRFRFPDGYEIYVRVIDASTLGQ